MELHVKGMVELQRNLAVDIPKQIRYAEMLTINQIAGEVQKHEVEKQLPSKLTLRSKGAPWWKPGSRYGVNRTFAKRDNLRAVVGSQADWLKYQEEGGTKKAQGHRLAIEAGARPEKSAILTRNIKPRTLLRRTGDTRTTKTGKVIVAKRSGKGFIIKTKSGPAIFIRENGNLKLMYMLEGSARMPAILKFYESGKALVESRYQEIFNINFNRALATAR